MKRFAAVAVAVLFAIAAGFTGCSKDETVSLSTFPLGGTVSGLSGTGLVLRNNGGDDKTITANGSFTFASNVATGETYNVTVKTQPTNQTCTVSNGSGTMAYGSVTNVTVACSNNPGVVTYTIGGTVSGLTGTGLVLQNNSGDDKTISSNGTFTFATAVADSGSYAVTVKTQPPFQFCSVENASGTVSGANVTNVAVSCSQRQWKGAVVIENSNDFVPAYPPQVAIDQSGNAMAVWVQSDGAVDSLWASLYSAAANTWSTAAMIESESGVVSWDPRVVMNQSGNALAVWVQHDGTENSVWARLYSAGTNTWGTATVIDANNNQISTYPEIAMNQSGNAAAVWTQGDGTHISSWANLHSAGTDTWTVAVQIDNGSTDTDYPHVAMDQNGNAMTVWVQDDGTGTLEVWAKLYSSGTQTWGAADKISVGSGYVARVAMDQNGNAMAIWWDDAWLVWASRYNATGGVWETPANIGGTGDGDFGSEPPEIVIDGSGNAVAVWYQLHNAAGGNVEAWANRYTAGAGWGTAAQIDAGGTHDVVSGPRLGVDQNGNALATWALSEGSIQVNRYTAGSGWGTPEVLDTRSDTASQPDIAVNGSGSAMAIWRQSDGTAESIWVNRFD